MKLSITLNVFSVINLNKMNPISGNLTEWTKCSNVTKTPGRVPFKIPDSLEENAAFKKYKFKKQERKFIDEAPSTSQMVKTESALPRLVFFHVLINPV